MVNSPGAPSFTLTNNSTMADSTLVRILTFTDNMVNRRGITNIGRRSLNATSGCEIYVADKDGSFEFSRGGEDRINKNIITMNWAAYRNRRAIEARYNPFPVRLRVSIDDGWNVNTGCDDSVSYTANCIVRIRDLGRFVSAFGLSLEQPEISITMVENTLNQAAVHIRTDEHGNVDPRQLFGLFGGLGLFLCGAPTVSNYHSNRLDEIKKRHQDWENRQRELEREKAKTSVEMERELAKSIPQLVADLTRAGMDACEINRAVDTICAQVKASSHRVQQSIEEQMESARRDYIASTRRIGNPDAARPTRMNRSLTAGRNDRFLPGPHSDNYSRCDALPNPDYRDQGSHRNSDRYNAREERQARPLQNPKSAVYKRIECRCGRTFDFTEGEREYYAEKGFAEPVRCPVCRRARKEQQGSAQADGIAPRTLHFGRFDR